MIVRFGEENGLRLTLYDTQNDKNGVYIYNRPVEQMDLTRSDIEFT